ncbi:MAG TPA: hypothetical protein V6D08_01575 [Candidatus Obscuribacterales bacterium]
MAEETHSDSSMAWLTFFFVCFILTMAIGAFAIFMYDVNAPEATPGGAGGHGSMILPVDGEYAPHARVWPAA